MANSESQRLAVDVVARIDKFERDMAKAARAANDNFGKIENRARRMGKKVEADLGGATSRINGQLAGIGRGLGAAIAGAFSVRGAKDLIDTSIRITNALKVSGLEGDKLTAVYDNLYASAQKNAAPLESLVTLYSRVSQVQKELGLSTADLLSFTDNVALALRVAGTDAATASGSLLQLSQALGGGVVRAEEFNSILEGTPTIAKAVAAGLAEAGGSVSTLRNLVIDGKVSSEAFFRAFEAGAATLQAQVSGSVLTVDQAFARLQNSLVDAARKLDGVTDASGSAVELLDRLAGTINGLSAVFAAAADGPIGSFINRLSQLNSLLQAVLPGINAIGLLDGSNLNQMADMIGPSKGPSSVPVAPGKGGRVVVDPIQRRIDQAFGTDKPRTVSLKDLAVPGARTGGRTGGGSASKGGSGGNDLQREIAHIKERTAAIQAETAAQSGINPLVDDYGFAISKAKVAQELLSAAQKAGVAITPELKAQIEALAGGYAGAEAEAKKLAETQDGIRQAADDFAALGKDVLGGFISDLRAGKTAAEALANAVQKLGDKLLDAGLDALFGGGSGGNILSLIPKLFGFAGGGYTGNGPRNQPAGVVHKGEFVMSKAATSRIGAGNLARLHKGYADGGFVGQTLGAPRVPAGGYGGRDGGVAAVRVYVDQDGNWQAKVESISNGVVRRAAPGIVGASVKTVKGQLGGMMADTQSREL